MDRYFLRIMADLDKPAGLLYLKIDFSDFPRTVEIEKEGVVAVQ
jgi:hypothetical protein